MPARNRRDNGESVFSYLASGSRREHRIAVTASANALVLGVLSSQQHVQWALSAGGTLGDRPVYNKSLCFETSHFPAEDASLTPDLSDHIRHLAEQLDAHRKARQAAFEAVKLP